MKIKLITNKTEVIVDSNKIKTTNRGGAGTKLIGKGEIKKILELEEESGIDVTKRKED